MKQDAGLPVRTPFFYGWILVVILLLLVSIGSGTTFYMYSVLAGAVGEEFSASRFVLMTGSTGLLLVMALSSPILGRLLDRYSSKWILAGGAFTMGMGFLSVAFSTNVWTVMVIYILIISIGAATMSPLATAILLTRWFVRHRGLAIGIAGLGTQFGGFFFPPLFATTIEAYDWRVAIAGMGILIMVIGPLLVWLFIVDRPELRNQQPLGEESIEDQGAGNNSAGQSIPKISLIDLLKHRNFWLVVLIGGAGYATNTVLLANLSLFATDLGESVVRGAFLVSLVAFIGVISSPLLGWLSDVINLKVVVAIMMLTFSVASLIFTVADSYPLLLLATAFMGIGGGGVFPIFASLVAHLYDARIYGQVLGTATLMNLVITASAPLFAGWVHDTTESYRILFLTLLVISVIIALLAMLLRVPKTLSEKFGADEETTVPPA